MADEELWRLADQAGIEPRYWDIGGNLHETTPDVARAILRALGLPAGSRADVTASLARLDEEKWQRTLPPVLIARENEDIAVPLRLPLQAAANVPWTVRLESGERFSGLCDPAALPVEETGHRQGVTAGLRHLRLAPLPAGYHGFRLDGDEEALLIVAPGRCHLPPDGRHWGIAAQLYALRSDTGWGIGDFGALRKLVAGAADAGAAAIGINPLHALFPDAQEQASPYSPGSRLFRNPLYLDITAIPELGESPEARALLDTPEMARAFRAMRACALVPYQAVAEIKLAVLKRLHRSFEALHLAQNTARGAAYRAYVEKAGDALQRFAAFEALCSRFGSHDWKTWPEGFRDCDPRALAGLQRDEASRIAFSCYLQWLCDAQLAEAGGAASKQMAIGLYNDLAVSVDAASADHWAHQDLFAGGLRIGAPPDPFNEEGQEWGVVPMRPRALRATRYAHYIAVLRANMRHAGALRIDHVMGWQRLFLIPAGAAAKDGAYVRFPLEDMLAIAALESQRNHCTVIGEDLGTVPEGFRERMAHANVLTCRVLYFERENARFRAPREYPALAAVTAATHDLPTLRGFWNGDDIAAKARLHAYCAEEELHARAERVADKRNLLTALDSEGLLPEGVSPAEPEEIHWTPALSRAIHRYLARTPSTLLMVQLDDLANEAQQANLPGSTTEYPNWRRRLSRTLAELYGDPIVRDQMADIAQERKAQRRD